MSNIQIRQTSPKLQKTTSIENLRSHESENEELDLYDEVTFQTEFYKVYQPGMFSLGGHFGPVKGNKLTIEAAIAKAKKEPESETARALEQLGIKIETYEKFNQFSSHKSLVMCIKHGDLESLDKFVNSGIDVNAKTYIGKTPLQIAALYNQKDMVKKLIRLGADINPKNILNGTLLHWAIVQNHQDIFELCIYKKANINEPGCQGNTPLQMAMLYNRPDMVETLIYFGADIHSKDQTLKHTPLSWSLENHYSKISKILLEHGVNVDDKCLEHNQSYLHFAILKELDDSIDLLLSFGANINLLNDKNESAMSLAISNKNYSLVTKFLEIMEQKEVYLCQLQHPKIYQDKTVEALFSSAKERLLLNPQPLKKRVNTNQPTTISNPLEFLSSFEFV